MDRASLARLPLPACPAHHHARRALGSLASPPDVYSRSPAVAARKGTSGLPSARRSWDTTSGIMEDWLRWSRRAALGPALTTCPPRRARSLNAARPEVSCCRAAPPGQTNVTRMDQRLAVSAAAPRLPGASSRAPRSGLPGISSRRRLAPPCGRRSQRHQLTRPHRPRDAPGTSPPSPRRIGCGGRRRGAPPSAQRSPLAFPAPLRLAISDPVLIVSGIQHQRVARPLCPCASSAITGRLTCCSPSGQRRPPMHHSHTGLPAPLPPHLGPPAHPTPARPSRPDRRWPPPRHQQTGPCVLMRIERILRITNV
jgi:hypothetical protein